MSGSRVAVASAIEFISLRNSLTGATVDFLQKETMSCIATQAGLVDLISALSNYHEEGRPLFPEICILDDLEQSLGLMSAVEHLQIGSGPKTSETLAKALKQCAGLAVSDWAIYILRCADSFKFGVFRCEGAELGLSIADRISDIDESTIKLLIVHQIAPHLVELRGLRKNQMVISFEAGARASNGISMIKRNFIPALCAAIDEPLREPAETFYTNLFAGVLKAGHGTLATVLDSEANELPSAFFDGIILSDPFSIGKRILEIQQSKDVSAAESIRAACSLISGMLLSDGITIFGSDGSVIAYRVFVKHPLDVSSTGTPVGGARRRTYAVLESMVGGHVAAVLMQSQDGQLHCASRIKGPQ